MLKKKKKGKTEKYTHSIQQNGLPTVSRSLEIMNVRLHDKRELRQQKEMLRVPMS